MCETVAQLEVGLPEELIKYDMGGGEMGSLPSTVTLAYHVLKFKSKYLGCADVHMSREADPLERPVKRKAGEKGSIDITDFFGAGACAEHKKRMDELDEQSADASTVAKRPKVAMLAAHRRHCVACTPVIVRVGLPG